MPRLRFPEFREAREWEPRGVGEVFNVTRGYVLSMTLVNDQKTNGTPYPVYSSQTKRNGLCGYYSEYLYNDAITWTTDGANAGDVKFREGKFYCTNVCGVLINEDGHANLCIAELINSVAKKHVSYVGNPKLMNGVMSRIIIPFPSLDEQQKIADCLSSLDALIAAQTEKIDVLKNHKKGLMQKLFPREGETVPRLRFPQFRDIGKWKEMTVSEVTQLISGLHLSPSEYSDVGCIPYFTGPSDFTGEESEISKWTNKSSNLALKNDVLITVKGSGVGMLWYLMLPSVAMGRQLMAIRANNCVSSFLFQFLSMKKGLFESLGTGNLIPGLSRGDILTLSLRFPPIEEQQKVADCLSSLDALIAAQMEKLDALKAHKKGLMQQLFPALEAME